ncbi:MAG: hypothetical protein ACLRNQ_02885 [Flavonifractor plautii]
MDRARLEQFNRFWEELLQAVPDARRQAVEEVGAAVQRELNAQIGAAELADGAKGTVRTWQESRVGSKGGYAALSPGKGTAQPRAGEAQRHLEGKARVQKAGHPVAGAGHGTRRLAAGSDRSWNQAGRAGVTRASAAGYVKGRQFYSWTKAKALELALKAADRVLSRIADEVDY